MAAREREEVDRCATHRCGGAKDSWKDGRWEKGSSPNGRECITTDDNMEVGEEATPLPCNH
jgi:hypothetical protein